MWQLPPPGTGEKNKESDDGGVPGAEDRAAAFTRPEASTGGRKDGGQGSWAGGDPSREAQKITMVLRVRPPPSESLGEG